MVCKNSNSFKSFSIFLAQKLPDILEMTNFNPLFAGMFHRVNSLFTALTLVILANIFGGFKPTADEYHPIRLSKPSTHFPEINYYVALGDFNTLVIPIKRAGKLILLDAIIDSISGNLILDTGSAGIVLNSIYFRGSYKSNNLVSGGVTGAMGAVSKKQVNKLDFAGMYFKDIEVNLADLGHLESARKVKILGFFGLCMLKNFEVVIDLANNQIELYRLDKFGDRLDKQHIRKQFDLSVPVYNHNDVLFVEGRVANKRLTFCLDTGAESNVLHSFLSNKALETLTITRRSILQGASKQKVETYYGVMNDFKIEGTQVIGMETLVTNLNPMSEAFGLQIDGMLGCTFFERGQFSFNMHQNTLGIRFYQNSIP